MGCFMSVRVLTKIEAQRVCSWDRVIQGFTETPLQPELLMCFQGDIESVLKKWLHSVLEAGGNGGEDGPLVILPGWMRHRWMEARA